MTYKETKINKEIPFGGNIFINDIIQKIYSLWKKDQETNIYQTMMLKMMLDENIEQVEKVDVGIFGRMKKQIFINFIKEPDDETLKCYYNLLKEAAGADGKLSNKELTKWTREHKSEFSKMNTAIENREKNELCEIIGTANIYDLKRLDKGIDAIDKINGYAKYLLNLTLQKERDVNEIVLWKDMMLMSSIYGIANKINKTTKSFCDDIKLYDMCMRYNNQIN